MKSIYINDIDYKNIDHTKTYNSINFGEFKILTYTNNRNVTIEFIDTGYKVNTCLTSVRIGKAKDSMRPNVYEVGYMGKGRYKSRVKGKDTKAYTTWRNMLERCYCPKYKERHPTYKGCTVAKEWHNFQEFAEWYENNYPH